MTKKRSLLNALLAQSAPWVTASLMNPNKHMHRVDLLLHCVALRIMGAPVPRYYPRQHPLYREVMPC